MRRTRSITLALTLLFLHTGLVLAQTPALTPHDVARLRSVSSVAISPDGARVAYLLAVPRNPIDEENGPAWGELHVVGRDGVSRPFVTGQVTLTHIRWTRDGRSISFLAKRGNDERRSLYLIDADGGEARRVLTHESDIGPYSWSPDGRRVAFLAREPKPKERTEREKRGFNARVYEEELQPERIWVASIDGKEKAKLVDVAGSASELHWGPVGSRIAVMIAPSPLVDESYTSRRIHVIDVDSGKVVGRVATEGKLEELAWSPDGRQIAFTAAADRHDPSAGRLMVAQAEGGSFRDILPGFEGNVNKVAWRDANTVLYLADEGVWTSLGEVRADGSRNRVVITAGQQPIMTALSTSRDGSTWAFAAETPQHPSEVYAASPTSTPRRLTNSNPWLADYALAPQEVVRYEARDGLAIEGMLIRPLGTPAAARSPLIVTIHGGPESHYRNGWLTAYSLPGQLAAGRGYAVFYPNYRGSTGRGVAFSKLGQRDPAGKEFDDIVDGVDNLVGTGLVDRNRVGATGGSYGGYATAWMSTYYTDRFAAGVMFVGISDMISKWGTTDIPQEEYLVHALQFPWEDWQFHLERSPIFYADRSKTPLLIMVGEEDPRVHPGQSFEMYRHLKVRGKAPVRLVTYPGEEHGNRRAAARLDYNLRMMRWFDHYLKGPGGAPPPPEVEYEAGSGSEEKEVKGGS